MIEPYRMISCKESQYNQLTHIAHLQGFLYPAGHAHAGKMNSSQTIEYLLKNFQDKIA